MKSTDNVPEELAKKFFGLEKKEKVAMGAPPYTRWNPFDYTTLTYEKCKNICSKYNKINELIKNHRQCWNVCKRNGWLYDFFDSTEPTPYDYEEAKKIVSEYKNRTVFMKEQYNLYCAILRNGDRALLDNLERGRRPNGYWNYEKCKEVALKYSTRKELAKKGGTCLRKIRSQGWYELLSHMKKLGNSYNRYIYVFEFDDKHAYIGLTWNPQIRKSDHLRSEHPRESSVKKHITKTNSKYTFKVLTPQPLDMNEVGEVENSYIKSYEEAGWTMLNKTRGGALGGNGGHTYEQCKNKVSEFEYMHEFHRNASGYYKRIRNMGWTELFDPLQTYEDYLSSDKYYLDKYPKEMELLNQNKTNREIHNETGIPINTIHTIRLKVGGPKTHASNGAVISEAEYAHSASLNGWREDVRFLK